MIDNDVDDCVAIIGMNNWDRNPKYMEKTCSRAALTLSY
jgi:hypothetical protein